MYSGLLHTGLYQRFIFKSKLQRNNTFHTKQKKAIRKVCEPISPFAHSNQVVCEPMSPHINYEQDICKPSIPPDEIEIPIATIMNFIEDNKNIQMAVVG